MQKIHYSLKDYLFVKIIDNRFYSNLLIKNQKGNQTVWILRGHIIACASFYDRSINILKKIAFDINDVILLGGKDLVHFNDHVLQVSLGMHKIVSIGTILDKYSSTSIVHMHYCCTYARNWRDQSRQNIFLLLYKK